MGHRLGAHQRAMLARIIGGSMKRTSFGACAAASVLFLLLTLPAPVIAQDVETTTVAGESEVSYEAATEKALRKAVREVVGVVLTSETKVLDFELKCT